MKSTQGATDRELFGQRIRSTVPSPPTVMGTVVYFLSQRMVGFYTLSNVVAHLTAVRVFPVHPNLPASTLFRGIVSLGFARYCATRSTLFD